MGWGGWVVGGEVGGMLALAKGRLEKDNQRTVLLKIVVGERLPSEVWICHVITH